MAVLTGQVLTATQFTSFCPNLSTDGHVFGAVTSPFLVEDSKTALTHIAVTRVGNVSVPAQMAIAGVKLKSYLQDYYFRVHVRPSRIDLGNLLSSQTRQVEVWNAHLTSKLLASITRESVEGLVLSEPVATPTTFGADEARVYTLSVSTNGPPVIDAKYTFNFPSEPVSLSVVGRRVVVWPFVPQTKFREQLQWMTDVMQAYSAEQRLALRAAPRQTLQYDFQLDQQQYSRAKAISTQWAHRVYGAPIWSESTRVGNLSAGITSIAFDTTNADYRANDIVLVWESDEKFVAAETTTMTAGGVTLKLPLDRSYSNAFVMPLRFARTLQGTEFSRMAHTVTRARLAFLVNNNVDLGASIGLPQYRGKDVMTDRSVVLSDMSEKIVRAVDVFDNGSGPVTIDQERAYPDRTEVLSMDPQNRAEVWRMRKWLHARRGKQRTFWLPGWNRDLILLENVLASATSMTVRPIGYPLYYGVTDIMVQLNSGALLFNRVLSGATDPSGNEVLALEAAFGTLISVADVALICFIKHVRLDTDNADINHDYAGRASCAVAVVEVPEGD